MLVSSTGCRNDVGAGWWGRDEKLLSWKIPEDARASGNGILIDGFAGDARFS